jgi:formate dehydrogenase assembly factor FdhD
MKTKTLIKAFMGQGMRKSLAVKIAKDCKETLCYMAKNGIFEIYKTAEEYLNGTYCYQHLEIEWNKGRK